MARLLEFNCQKWLFFSFCSLHIHTKRAIVRAIIKSCNRRPNITDHFMFLFVNVYSWCNGRPSTMTTSLRKLAGGVNCMHVSVE